MRRTWMVVAFVFVLAVAGSAGAQILVNGGFEAPVVTDGAGWDIYRASDELMAAIFAALESSDRFHERAQQPHQTSEEREQVRKRKWWQIWRIAKHREAAVRRSGNPV